MATESRRQIYHPKPASNRSAEEPVPGHKRGGAEKSVLLPVDTCNYYLSLQAKNVGQAQHMATPAWIKKNGRSYLKTYAFMLFMFCKVRVVLLLLQTTVFLQRLWCIKKITVLVSEFVPLLENLHCKQIRSIRNCTFFVFT